MKKIGHDAYKITGDCNVYLLLSPEPCVIDTGQPAEREHIAEQIKTKIPLENIKHVFLTHLHYDHCGNVNLFKNAKFYCSQEEIDDLRNKPQNFFFGEMPKELRIILMNQLETIPNQINGLRVISVPGHTRGSLSLMDENRKILFSGDTIFHNGIGRTDFENSVPEKMGSSLIKLKRELAKGDIQLMPGHDY